MAQVDISINGTNYSIVCDDGQEEHLLGLAEEVNARVVDLRAAVGQVGDARLLVMASLLLADELSETRRSVIDLRTAIDRNQGGVRYLAEEEAAADAIERVASRIEDIVARLEHP